MRSMRLSPRGKYKRERDPLYPERWDQQRQPRNQHSLRPARGIACWVVQSLPLFWPRLVAWSLALALSRYLTPRI